MKLFSEMRKKMPAGEHVFSKKVNRHKVMIHKDKKGFSVYIDGDKLDKPIVLRKKQRRWV